MKKKMITFTVLGLTFAAGLTVGNITLAEKPNNNGSQMMNSDTMSSMMSNGNMSGMMNMMENPSMGNMMDSMDSPEGKKMVESCNEFMKSSQDNEGQQDSKNKELKPKETSL